MTDSTVMRRATGVCACAMVLLLTCPAAAVTFTNRGTKAESTNVVALGTWAAKALEERYTAIGEPTDILPQADSSQHFLQTVKTHIEYLAPFFVCHTNASGGTFTTYFQTPTSPGGTNYPTSFPMWDTAWLLEHVGAPTDWFSSAPWRPGISDSNGWLYVSNMISALRWTCVTASDGIDYVQKNIRGLSNSLDAAKSQEADEWGSASYSSGGSCFFAAAAVCYTNKGSPNSYYVRGYRGYGKPVVDDIPTTSAHRASWYLLFEQGQGYSSSGFDHPYFLHDGVSGLSVDSPHVAYVEELAISSSASETGNRPFESGTSADDPGVWARLPAVGFLCQVEYVACDTALWLLKWDVAGGFQHR